MDPRKVKQKQNPSNIHKISESNVGETRWGRIKNEIFREV
jgi:hypothetical protein